MPTEDELRSIYDWEKYHLKHYAKFDPAIYRRSLDLLSARCPGKRTLLDFGCGSGGFLIAAKGAGYECQGVEYEARAIEKAQETAGVPVSSVEALAAGPQFDIIRLSDVHPHLPDPAATFRRLELSLAPGGLFFIEGPLENNASLVYYTAVATKTLRRRIGLDTPASIAPTMLMRLNRKGQREFFCRRLGYREVYFEVYETGWPYYVPGRPLRSPAAWIKQAVGALAIVVSCLQDSPARLLGNRFTGVFDPQGANGH